MRARRARARRARGAGGRAEGQAGRRARGCSGVNPAASRRTRQATDGRVGARKAAREDARGRARAREGMPGRRVAWVASRVGIARRAGGGPLQRVTLAASALTISVGDHVSLQPRRALLLSAATPLRGPWGRAGRVRVSLFDARAERHRRTRQRAAWPSRASLFFTGATTTPAPRRRARATGDGAALPRRVTGARLESAPALRALPQCVSPGTPCR